jgi:protein TonB
MKKIILITLAISSMNCSVSKKKEKNQEAIIHEVVLSPNTPKDKKGEEIFTVVEKQPEFPGGQKALDDFIKLNLKDSRKYKKGNVYAQFIIEKDGSITDIKIIRGLSNKQDIEVVRLISTMPNWIPGKQREKKRRVRYVLPVKFN